jgi:signal recognition particle subunit SEC65
MKITLYSAYFNPSLTRRQGRRVSSTASRNFDDKKLQDILRGLQVKFDTREGRYPRASWLPSLIYDIESDMHKTTLIKTIERKLS